MGGVANWQDRTAKLIEDLPDVPVYLLAGTRVMQLPTERANRNIQVMFDRLSRYPTEAEYVNGNEEEEVAGIVVPMLEAAGRDVTPVTFDTGDGDAMFEQFFTDRPELLHSRLAMARVANAGIVMAIQMRDAARRVGRANKTFAVPQVLIATDTLPIARTDEQDADASHYQKAATALRQAILTAKKLHETADGK